MSAKFPTHIISRLNDYKTFDTPQQMIGTKDVCKMIPETIGTVT